MSRTISPAQLELKRPIVPEMRILIRNWASGILAGSGIAIRSLRSSCGDGVVVLTLLERLIGRDIGVPWRASPVGIRESRSNVAIALRFLEENAIIEPGVVSPDDVIWGGEGFVFYLLHRIYRRFRTQGAARIVPHGERAGSRRSSNGRR
jgi:hypothetical protein